MADKLSGPNLKLDRAKTHIDDLNYIVQRLVESHKGTVSVEQDADPGFLLCVSNEPFKLPPQFPLIVGDAVHNLHTAWDHLAVLLVRGKCRKAQFPFGRTMARFESELIERGLIRFCSDGVIDNIRRLQPYFTDGADTEFYGLHDLDRLDKHRVILTIAQMEGVPWVGKITGPYGGIKGGFAAFTKENGREVCRFTVDSNVKVGDNLNPGLGVFFGNSVLAKMSVTRTFAPFV